MVSEIENLPEQLNAASVFIDENIKEGRGDNVALLYGDETLTYQDVSEMVNKTGDKYYQDRDGYFWHCGRSDDMMKVSGMWVSPVEIENILASHEAVLECAVVGDLDEDKLVKPKAFVVLKDGVTPSSGLKEELQRFVLERAAPYKHPRWIEFIESLPRTATGKVQRFRLRG